MSLLPIFVLISTHQDNSLLGDKILLLTGPRQCGKTTLSKMLNPDYQCINYDLAEHRLLLKEPKYYFYDNAMAEGNEGIKLENLVACALLKETQRRQDVEGENFSMHYIRNKDGQEIDFLITQENRPCFDNLMLTYHNMYKHIYVFDIVREVNSFF